MEKQKYCSDCYFARNRHVAAAEWNCRSPINVIVDPISATTRISLVTGDPIPAIETCLAAREIPEFCGPEGNWFKSRTQVLAEYDRNKVVSVTTVNKKLSGIEVGDL